MWNSAQYHELAGEDPASPRANSSAGRSIPAVVETTSSSSSSMITVGRYRVTPGGAFPAGCELMDHALASHITSIASSSTSTRHQQKWIDACIVGGVERKLQQFCQTQGKRSTSDGSSSSGRSYSWRMIQFALLSVYVSSILLLGILAEGPVTPTAAAAAATSQHYHRRGVCLFGIGLPILTMMYIAAAAFLSTKWKISQDFRSKLDNLVHEISEELADSDYTIIQADKEGSLRNPFRLLGSCQIHITVQRPREEHGVGLPPVSQEFLSSVSELSHKDLRVNAESIIYGTYYGPLPIDDWLLGGLMLRLRLERHRASIRSRLFGLAMLVPIGVLSILLVASGSGDDDNNNNGSQRETSLAPRTESSGLHALLCSLAIGGILFAIYVYVREYFDGTAIHGVSKIVTKQLSSLARDRHGYTIQYEVQPGILPRTTRGVLLLQPISSSISVEQSPHSPKKISEKSAAQIAFV